MEVDYRLLVVVLADRYASWRTSRRARPGIRQPPIIGPLDAEAAPRLLWRSGTGCDRQQLGRGQDSVWQSLAQARMRHSASGGAAAGTPGWPSARPAKRWNCFRRAMQLGRKCGALAWEAAQPAMSLVRLRERPGWRHAAGKLAEARSCLPRICYARLTEGFAFPDLQEAAALIGDSR